MKIVILNTSERIGGAAVAAHRLMCALQKQGVEVKMLVRDKQTEEADVCLASSNWFVKYWNRLRFYWERGVIFGANHFRKADLFRVSLANTGMDISENRWVQEADVIHIHWINQGFLSLSDIRKLARLDKPIVWTMHDMWPCTGICHHARQCVNYHTLCQQCFYLKSQKEDLATTVYRKKLKLYERVSMLTFVGCSHWLEKRAMQSGLMRGKKVVSIPNPIDIRKFSPQNKSACRMKLGLPLNKVLVLFGALNVMDPRKGVNYLLEALPLLTDKNLELVVFGQVKEEIQNKVPVLVHSMGYMSDEEKISSLYNAVDLFVTSSLDENLPNTIMEAMACGTPCVGFNTGGIPEMIDHQQNGYVAKYMGADDLAEGIRWVIEHPNQEALSRACVEKVRRCYAEEVVAKQYIHLYQTLLKRT